MDLKAILSANELKTRKIWLYVFLISNALILSCFIYSKLIDNKRDLVQLLIDVATWAGFNYLWFHCCYKKPGTILLAIGLVGMAFGLMGFVITFGVSLFLTLSPLNIPLAIGILLGYGLSGSFFLYMYLINWRLRRINKVIKCYCQFPHDLCSAASTHIQGAESLEHLERLYQEAIQKWPSLNPLLARERQSIKEKLKASS